MVARLIICFDRTWDRPDDSTGEEPLAGRCALPAPQPESCPEFVATSRQVADLPPGSAVMTARQAAP